MATRTTPDVLAGLGQDGDDALGAAMGPQVMALDIAVIRLDGGTQPRAGIDQAVVADYANDMEANGAEFPPVQVVYDGEAYWLWDGFHRLHARTRNGLHTAPAIVRQGTRRDAVLLSVGANATHGFRRTNEDKRRAVMALLEDEEWGQWSDSEIARRCAVSHPFVGKLRAELSCNGYRMETRRVQRNGTEYTMATPQRSAGAAVASQEGKWLNLAELTAQVRGWADVWEEPAQALRGLNSESVGGGGDYWDDWRNWVDGHYSSGMLGEAIKAVLRDVEPETDGRGGHSITRPVFDIEMRLATPRQVRAQEMKDRLDRARAQAMAADAEWAIARGAQQVAETPERARSETGPSGEGQPAARGREMVFDRKELNQGRKIKIFGRNVDGTLTVTVDADGYHLYSPGITMTLEDAYNLTVMMQRALGQMHLVRTKEMDHA